MLKTMKKMGVKKEPLPHGLKPLEFSEMQESDDADGGKAYVDDGCVHNVDRGDRYLFHGITKSVIINS